MPEETYNTAERIAGILSAIGAVGQGHLERRKTRMDEEALKKEAAQRRKEEIQLMFAKMGLPTQTVDSASLELTDPQPAGFMPIGQRGQVPNEHRNPLMADWDDSPPSESPTDWGNVPRPEAQKQWMPTNVYGPQRESTFPELLARLTGKVQAGEQYERDQNAAAAEWQRTLDQSKLDDILNDNQYNKDKMAQDADQKERDRKNARVVAGTRLQAADDRYKVRQVEKLDTDITATFRRLIDKLQTSRDRTDTKANKLGNIKASVFPAVNAFVLRKSETADVTDDEVKKLMRDEALKTYRSVGVKPGSVDEINALVEEMYREWESEFVDE